MQAVPQRSCQAAKTLTLAAQADGYITDFCRPLNTLGSALIASSSNCGSETRSVLTFSLASLPEAARVTRVRLRVFVAECRFALENTPFTLDCYGHAGAGKLSREDACAGAQVGSSLLSVARFAGELHLSLVPAFVQAMRRTEHVGLHLRVSAPTVGRQTNYLLLRSRENIHPEACPQLVIDYLPLPSHNDSQS